MSTVSDSLIDAINDDAFGELEAEVIIEKVEIPIINNDDTIKKIEDSRKFLSADSAAAKEAFGLKTKEAAQQAKSQYETTRASTASTSSAYGYKSTETTSSSYRYGYAVPEKESIQIKAAKATAEAFTKIKEKVDKEMKRNSLKTNWNVLEMMDEAKLKELQKPKKILTPQQVKKKLFWTKMKLGGIKLAMEVLYIVSKEG